MTIRAFLRARIALVTVVVLAAAFVCLMMSVSGCSVHTIILAACVLLCGLAVGLALEYARTKSFYRELSQLSEHLEHPYQAASLMSKPKQSEQLVVYRALQTMGRACATEVACAKSAQDEQREYTEQWVHEIKAPLSAALLVANRVAKPEASQLKNEIDRSLYQVDQVLWYARCLSAQTDYRIRSVSLANIVRAVCRSNARFLIERGVSVSLDVPDDLQVFTDEKQAAFIVSQAVVNAAKYGASHLTFMARDTQDTAGARCVTLAIADDGWGIPEEDVPRVFERGFTGTRGRQAGSSTGMGLYLAATLCEKLGLGLSLSSKEGEGTTVELRFPFDERRLSVE